MEPVERLSTAPLDRVWEVLADGWTYPVWVVGASRMRAVSASWPQVGAELHHSAGVWPALVNDKTTVKDVDPGRRLVLIAKGRPFGSALVEITLEPRDGGTLIRIKEDVVSGPTKVVPQAIRQAGVVARNRETLHRLALIAERPTKA